MIIGRPLRWFIYTLKTSDDFRNCSAFNIGFSMFTCRGSPLDRHVLSVDYCLVSRSTGQLLAPADLSQTWSRKMNSFYAKNKIDLVFVLASDYELNLIGFPLD